MAKNWSNYQTSIFDFIKTGKGNLIVKAVAGSGKSTTSVEALKYAEGSSIFLAYNKAIAEELKLRGVNARTFHSLTYSAVLKFKGVKTVESNKLRLLSKKHFKGTDDFYYGAFCARLVGLARQSGVDCIVPDTEQVWNDLVSHHNLELENEKDDNGHPLTIARAVELSRSLLKISNESNLVDFDDLLYFAVKFGISLQKFDFVFVDESQDVNAVQRAILRKLMNTKSRIVCVGDPAQAIYGFRGADSESMSMIAKEFNCIELPLTVSYRCPQAVVRHAQQWVSHIEHAPTAPEGEVINLDKNWSVDTFKPNDLVICRTNKPLIALAYKLLIARKPAYIMGKEIGAGLKAQINRMEATSLEDLGLAMQEWSSREIEKANAKMQEDKAAAIQDKYDAIMCLVDSMPEGQRTIKALLETIDKLFSSKENAIVLASIHKSKGLEAKRVLWLNSRQCPAPWAKRDWQQEQELNLCYVATTRAMDTLILIEEDKKQK